MFFEYVPCVKALAAHDDGHQAQDVGVEQLLGAIVQAVCVLEGQVELVGHQQLVQWQRLAVRAIGPWHVVQAPTVDVDWVQAVSMGPCLKWKPCSLMLMHTPFPSRGVKT